LRADGSPTYLLAVVVDDHDMEVSHVIRGSDHISNTPRQLAIYNALGWEPPLFGHIPLIHGSDGQKLSKRHGATGAQEYEALGYLPEAMRNYLSRLSWAHGNDEIFSTEQAIEWFELSGCSKSASCFDFDKLNDLNMHYIKEADPKRLLDILCKFNPECVPFAEKLTMAVDMLKPRAKTMIEYRQAADFIIVQRPLTIEEKAAKSTTTDAGKEVLGAIKEHLLGYSGAWTTEALEPVVNKLAEDKALKLGQVASPMRAALTGSSASPGIYEVMWVLGKEEVLGRLQDAVEGKNPIKAAPKKEVPPPKEDKKSAKAGKGAPVPADQPEFTKLEIKVGVLKKTWAHPDSEKLFCEEIDVGEEQVRSVASGLRAFYTEEQFAPGRLVAVVTNLKPAKMAGFESAGMVLAASNEDHTKVELIEVPAGAKPGERVFIEGLTGDALPPNQCNKKNVLKNVLPDLKTDASCVACWQGKPLMTSAGPLRVPTMSGVNVG
jgi:methionine--tRNA ligase beta chain